MTFPIFPDQASEVARKTDHLYWGLIFLSTGVLLVVFLPIIVFLFKYRRGKKADRSPVHLPEMKIEITWTVIPLVVFTGLFAWGANIYYTIERIPADAMNVDVVGKQWMWKIQHPEGNREINELHVPIGRVVKLTIASQDVIHSFFMPAFRIKQDAVPGRYTTLWFKADKAGTYHLFCSEYCGAQHSQMHGRIIVMQPADFQAWLSAGQPGSTLAQSGEQLYRELGCSGCHEGSTTVRAPPLQGLYEKPVPLQTRQVVTADEAYIRDSILLPAKDIAAGYTNDMPSFQGHVSEEQLFALVEYIKSIANASPPMQNVREGK